MSDLKPDITSKDIIEAAFKDTVPNLKRQLTSANLMVMAIMDQANISEIILSRESLITASGYIVTHYDFDTDGYVVRRVK